MVLIKTIPKDNSDEIDWDNSKGFLKCSKPYLVIYQMTETEKGFRRGQYIPTRKFWVDWEGFIIDKVLGHYDVDQLLK